MMNKLKSFLQNRWKGFFSIALFLLWWELAVPEGSRKVIFFSRPTLIFEQGWQMIESGFLFPHLISSLGNLLTGIGLALVFALVVALLFGVQSRVYGFFEPFVYVLSTVPKIAFLPLIIIWVGVGTPSKILIVFIMALVPILINALQGVQNANSEYVAMAKSFGAGKMYLTFNILFFETLPNLFSGLKIALGRGISGLIVAEGFGKGSGLGYLVSYYGLSFQSGKLMFTIFVLFCIVLLLKNLITSLEKRTLGWNK